MSLTSDCAYLGVCLRLLLGHDGLGAAVEVIGRVCEGAGLHRTMVTRLVVPEQHGGGGVVVAERITRDMYVDLDQVKSVPVITCMYAHVHWGIKSVGLP